MKSRAPAKTQINCQSKFSQLIATLTDRISNKENSKQSISKCSTCVPTSMHTRYNSKILTFSNNAPSNSVFSNANKSTDIIFVNPVVHKSQSQMFTPSGNHRKEQIDSIYYIRKSPVRQRKLTVIESNKDALNESSYEQAHRLDDRNSFYDIAMSESKANKIESEIKSRLMVSNANNINSMAISKYQSTSTTLDQTMHLNKECKFQPVLITKYGKAFLNTKSKFLNNLKLLNYNKKEVDTYRSSKSYRVKEMIRKKCFL